MDQLFSLSACLNLACAHLSYDKNKGYHQEVALKELQQAEIVIENTYQNHLIVMNTLIGLSGGGQQTAEHIRHQMDVLAQVKSHCNDACHVIQDAIKNENNVKIEQFDISDVFDESVRANYAQVVSEIKLDGLTQLFTVKEKLPRPWLSIIGVTLLGIAQIAAGCLMTIYSGGLLGKGWIAEGVSDMITAVKAAITGSFSWAAYAAEKAISLVISFATSGISALKKGLSFLQPLKDGLKTVAKTATNVIGKTVSTLTVQEGVKLAAKQVGVAIAKGAAKECINALGNWATDQAFKETVDKIITEKVAEMLKQALSNNQTVTDCLSLDIKNNNNHFQNIFIAEGMKLLLVKENKFLEALLKICKGVFANTDYLGGKILEVASLSGMVEELACFTANFTDALMQKIEENQAVKDALQGAKEQAKVSETENATQNEFADLQTGSTETVDAGQHVMPNQGNDSIEEHIRGTSYSSKLDSEVPNVNGTSFAPSSLAALSKPFQAQIVARLTNSVRSNFSNSVINPLASMTVDSLSAGIEKKLENKRIDQENICNFEGSEARLSKGREKTTDQGKPSERTVQEVERIKNGEPLNRTNIASAAAEFKIRIHVYDENGKLLRKLGPSGNGEPVKMKFSQKNGEDVGHYEPMDGSAVTPTGENNCGWDMLAQRLGLSTQDVKARTIQHIEQNAQRMDAHLSYRDKVGGKRDMMVGGHYNSGRNASQDWEDESSDPFLPESSLSDEKSKKKAVDKLSKYINAGEGNIEKKKLEKIIKTNMNKLCSEHPRIVAAEGKKLTRQEVRHNMKQGRIIHRKMEQRIKSCKNIDGVDYLPNVESEVSFNNRGVRGRVDILHVIPETRENVSAGPERKSQKVRGNVYDLKSSAKACQPGETDMTQPTYTKYKNKYGGKVYTANANKEIKEVQESDYKKNKK